MLIATLEPDVTTYGDAGLSASTTYDYRVSAYNSTATSDAAEASATTFENASIELTSVGYKKKGKWVFS